RVWLRNLNAVRGPLAGREPYGLILKGCVELRGRKQARRSDCCPLHRLSGHTHDGVRARTGKACQRAEKLSRKVSLDPTVRADFRATVLNPENPHYRCIEHCKN